MEGPREVVRVDVDGDVAETSRFAAGWTPPRSSFTVNSTMSFSEGRFTTESSIARVAFLPRLLWDALPHGGLAMSDSSAYAIRILDASGNVVRVLRRPLPRRPITAAFRRAPGDPAEEPGQQASAPVDMLTPDGAYVGTVRKLRWPAALGPGNRAAYIEVDEFGIPTVLVGRLSLSSCPLG